MATQRGKAVVWGVDGVTFTGFGSVTAESNSMDFERSADQKEIPDDIGNTVGLVLYNSKNTFRMTVTPSAATIAAAKTNMDGFTPVPGTIITVADADSTITDGTQTGKYILLSAKLNRAQNSEATVDMELVQWVDNDVAVAIT